MHRVHRQTYLTRNALIRVLAIIVVSTLLLAFAAPGPSADFAHITLWLPVFAFGLPIPLEEFSGLLSDDVLASASPLVPVPSPRAPPAT